MAHLVQVALEHVALLEAIPWLLCARLLTCPFFLSAHTTVSKPASRARPELLWAVQWPAEVLIARRADRPKLAACVHLLGSYIYFTSTPKVFQI